MTKFDRPPIYLASTDSEAVHADVYAIFSDWNGSRQTLRLRSDLSIIEPPEENEPIEPSPSGYRLDIRPIGDRKIQDPVLDEEGNVITPAVYAGEKRVDIITVEGFQETEHCNRDLPETCV